MVFSALVVVHVASVLGGAIARGKLHLWTGGGKGGGGDQGGVEKVEHGEGVNS